MKKKLLSLLILLLPIFSLAEGNNSDQLQNALEWVEKVEELSLDFETVFTFSIDTENIEELKQTCFHKLDQLHTIYEATQKTEKKLKDAVSSSNQADKDHIIKAREKLSSAQSRINDTLYNIESIFAQKFPENISMFMDEAQAYFATARQLLNHAKSEIEVALNN